MQIRSKGRSNLVPLDPEIEATARKCGTRGKLADKMDGPPDNMNTDEMLRQLFGMVEAQNTTIMALQNEVRNPPPQQQRLQVNPEED